MLTGMAPTGRWGVSTSVDLLTAEVPLVKNFFVAFTAPLAAATAALVLLTTLVAPPPVLAKDAFEAS